MRKTRVGFISLGCPKNQIDTEVMLSELVAAGYEITPEDIKADIIIVNTCAFIESAKKEAIDNILDVAWLKQKRLRGIIVTGCLAQRYGEQLLSEMPEIDAVLGTGSLHDIVAAVKAVDERTRDKVGAGHDDIVDGDASVESENARYAARETGSETGSDASAHEAGAANVHGCSGSCSACSSVCDSCGGHVCGVDGIEADGNGKYISVRPLESLALGGDRVVTTPDCYSYLKIAEGCDNRCTYCIIPTLRGRFRSRPMEDIIAEAKELESMGTKELILVAQDTSRYGEDLYGEYSLARLLRELTEQTSIPWIRLLYLYPDKITDELTAEIRDNDRICKYVDIPIQHISEDVLRRMNRHGGSAVVRDAVSRLRREIPGIVIRTTAIVGFPGETEEEFEELCTYVKEARFDRFGAFPYSREEDTPAYSFPDQIDEQTKQDRYDIIMNTQLGITDELNRKKLGKRLTVLCEGYDPVSEAHYGRSYADAPEIDGKIFFTAEHRVKDGEFVTVKITDVLDYDLYGKAVSE